jgi:hypothetical protein
MRKNRSHPVKRTILIVVEGFADEYFLSYLKNIFHVRKSGFTVNIKNARGKGALNVINTAKKLNNNIKHDLVCVLFDTDKDWNEEAKSIVNQNKFVIFPADPCLESEILQIVFENPEITTELIKKQFHKKFGKRADEIEDYSDILPADELQKSALKDGWLKNIVQVLAVGKP